MKDFIFRNDTKLLFRNDLRQTLADITKCHKVMLVYGGGSVKRNGFYDDAVQTFKEAGIDFIEYGGSSREFEMIQKGIQMARDNNVTMIVGAGGASVMDSAKLIAFGYYHEADLWDYVKGKSPNGQQRLRLALVPTYPSSGSENGLGAVSIDSRSGDFGTAYGIGADYAILCPKYSLTLSSEMTSYTGLVTLVQLTACILGDRNLMSYDAGVSYIKNVVKAIKRLSDHPDDLDARGIIMMGASLSTSSRLGIGKEEFYAYDIYEIEFLPEKLFGSTYRRSLTSIFPRFLQIMARHHEGDIKNYFHDVFGWDGPVDESCSKLLDAFAKMGVEMYYDDNFTRDEVDAIPRRTELSKEEVYEMMQALVRK